MIKDNLAKLLMKFGVISLLAGFFPLSAYVYDMLTCNEADAVVEAVQPNGKVKVAFTDANGRPVVASAASHHLRMGDHAFASWTTGTRTTASVPVIDATAKALQLRGRPVASIGETVRVIYRSAKPTSLAPHRNPMDAMFGLAGMVLGVLMLLARRAMASHGATHQTQHKIAHGRVGTRAPAGPIRPQRTGVVQRERGWI